MPHIIVKYFETPLTQAQIDHLSRSITRAVSDTFGCASGMVSISLRPIRSDRWNEDVFIPDIEARKHELIRIPNYAAT